MDPILNNQGFVGYIRYCMSIIIKIAESLRKFEILKLFQFSNVFKCVRYLQRQILKIIRFQKWRKMETSTQ